MPVEPIAQDLPGLAVTERDLEGTLGILYWAERQVYLNADPPTRRSTAASPWLREFAGNLVGSYLLGTWPPAPVATSRGVLA